MKVKSLIRQFEEIVAAGFIMVMVVIVIANVLLRYFSNYSIYWGEEVATICFVWAVFIGAASTYKHKMDIGIDFLVNKTTGQTKRLLRFLTTSLLLLINAYILVISIIFTVIAIEKPTAVLGVSSAVVNSALIVAFALITLHSIRFWLRELQQLTAKSA